MYVEASLAAGVASLGRWYLTARAEAFPSPRSRPAGRNSSGVGSRSSAFRASGGRTLRRGERAATILNAPAICGRGGRGSCHAMLDVPWAEGADRRVSHTVARPVGGLDVAAARIYSSIGRCCFGARCAVTMSNDQPAEVEKLLAVRPDEFVHERQRLARELRDAGRSDEAATVAQLRKPSPVVLAVNRAARARPKAARAAADAALRVRRPKSAVIPRYSERCSPNSRIH